MYAADLPTVPGTELVPLDARDYDGDVGRWTTKDPVGFGGGAAAFFVFVSNDPVNKSDPNGL